MLKILEFLAGDFIKTPSYEDDHMSCDSQDFENILGVILLKCYRIMTNDNVHTIDIKPRHISIVFDVGPTDIPGVVPEENMPHVLSGLGSLLASLDDAKSSSRDDFERKFSINKGMFLNPLAILMAISINVPSELEEYMGGIEYSCLRADCLNDLATKSTTVTGSLRADLLMHGVSFVTIGLDKGAMDKLAPVQIK